MSTIPGGSPRPRYPLRMAEPRQVIQQALAQAQTGRLGPAIAALERLVQKKGAPPEAPHFLGMLLFQDGRYEQAIFHLDRASRMAPGRAQFESNFANVLQACGRVEDALARYATAISADASYAPAHTGLAGALLVLGRLTEAQDHARRAWALAPDNPEAAANLASCLIVTGRAGEAVTHLERAIAALGPSVPLHTLLAAAMNYDAHTTPERSLDAHRMLGRLHASAARAIADALPPITRLGRSGENLRVGYLSADFRDHPVAMFIEPALETDDEVRVFCYDTTPGSGQPMGIGAGVTWRDARRLTDAELVAIVRGDSIDVLVELSGHSLGHRQTALAARMAPVQVSFLGYPATTGNPSIDARIVDARSDPGGSEAWCTERLIRLNPCAWCFTAPPGAPEVATPPCRGAEPVTFGSFNNLAKTVPEVLDAWARLLARVPGSRLLLKNGAFIDRATRERVLDALVARGVEPRSVELLAPTSGAADHLAAYARIDIALDTFPYAGTTTTCEALWMGVPVVTLAGALHAGRVGVSILGVLGLDELVAGDVEGYVHAAAALAADPARRIDLRRMLRDRLRTSPLMDRAAYRARLHAAYAGLVREGGKD